MDPTLARRFGAVRARSMALAAPLSAEDCGAQAMPDASPVKWHLAHTTWFFETFILEPHEPDFAPFDPRFRVLFNSYYNGVGARHPRAARGLLTRPSLAEVLAYRAAVDARMRGLLERDAAIGALVELGLQHEQQHQELILTDVKALLGATSVYGAYEPAPLSAGPAAPPLRWLEFGGGVVGVGHAGAGFCFDNELPRHRQFLEPFALASRLVSNGEFLAFVEDGGYRDPSLWLSEGWDWVCASGRMHPLYWQHGEGGWREFTLHGLGPLDPARPVTHVSLYEAEAYAQWLRRTVPGVRLPTEAEWEHAAAGRDERYEGALHPRAAGVGMTQLFGECWQWTSSGYAPYPGYAPAAGAIGEYNGKFMVNQYVLRGASCATPPGHARATYRNFFPAYAQWQFTGIRLARGSA